jgi:hypothetical protein
MTPRAAAPRVGTPLRPSTRLGAGLRTSKAEASDGHRHDETSTFHVTQPPDAADATQDIGAYCREIEAYLCRRNGGHLIRIVGPAFMLAADWARRGVPLRVVLHGIDRRVARSEAKGGTRRPLRLEFCEADVEDAFAQWRRAVGGHAVRRLSDDAATAGDEPDDTVPAAGTAVASRRPSLPRHIERVIERLSSVRAATPFSPEAGAAIDAALHQLGLHLGRARGARGDARHAVEVELRALDESLLDLVVRSAPAAQVEDARAQARRELQTLAARMTPDARADAERRLVRHLVRTALGLPQIATDG